MDVLSSLLQVAPGELLVKGQTTDERMEKGSGLLITRTILIQPRAGIEEEVVTDTLLRFHTLREQCSGIFDVQVAKSSHPDYPYGVVIRYTRPLVAGGLFHQKYYQAIIDDLGQIAHAILAFDVGGERDRSAYLDETEYTLAEQADQTFAYGNFKPTVEERVRKLVRLWTRGNGQLLTEETELIDPEDTFGLDLAQLDYAMRAEFGVSFLEQTSLQFKDIVRFVDEHVKKLQSDKGEQ